MLKATPEDLRNFFGFIIFGGGRERKRRGERVWTGGVGRGGKEQGH